AGPRDRRPSRQSAPGPEFDGRAPDRVLAVAPLGAGHTDGATPWLPGAIHVGRPCTPRVQASRRGAPERASARDRSLEYQASEVVCRLAMTSSVSWDVSSWCRSCVRPCPALDYPASG